jgi:hypothetical protein
MFPKGLLPVLVFGLACALAGTASAAEPADAKHITQLVEQLGSPRFAERESASQALDVLGAAALPRLREAARGPDLETRRRAEELVARIAKRVETERLLAPKRLRLVCSETPVPEAIAQLEKKSGIAIQVGGFANNLASRKITLDTGETTFWEAFDQLCQQGGLVERGLTAASGQEIRNPYGTTPAQVRRLIEAQARAQGTGGIPDNRLVVVDGKTPKMPTYQAGAVRICALPPLPQTTGQSPLTGETLVLLDVLPEPRLPWHNIVDLRIDLAVDDKGQHLVQPVNIAGEAVEIGGNGGMAVMWDVSATMGLPFQRQTAIRLRLGQEPSRLLKELKGRLSAQVQTPVQELIVVDDIMQATGKTYQGAEGENLRVVDVNGQTNGQVRLRVQLDVPLFQGGGAAGAIAMNGAVLRANRVVFNGRPFRGAVAQDLNEADGLVWTVRDAQGREFKGTPTGQDLAAGANGLATQWQLSFQLGKDHAEPLQLICSGRRTALVEIPFTLKDVPLPLSPAE